MQRDISNLTLLSMFIILTCHFHVAFTETDDDDHHESDEHGHDDHDEEDEHGNVLLPILITILSGFAACIGALSIFCIKKQHIHNGLIPISLCFSAGVVVYLCFMNLIPESMAQFNESNDEAISHLYTSICVIAGLSLVFVTESVFKRLGVDPHGIVHANEHDANSEQQVQPVSTGNTHPNNLKHLSYFLACALIMHHLPEGIATFISLYHDLEFGILVAFALFLHDIPSGVCIAVPAYIATGSKMQPFILCLIAAAAYPIGACIGWVIVETASQQFADSFVAVLLGMTAGIMLHIAFIELLPTAMVCVKNRETEMETQPKHGHGHASAVAIGALFAGLLVMDISGIVLAAVGGHSHDH